MFQQSSNYDFNAFPPSLRYASVFLSSVFAGLLMFGAFASTLPA